MKVCYTDSFNFELGLLSVLHPFDGTKFRRAFGDLRGRTGIEIVEPAAPIDQERIDRFVDPLVGRFLRHKEHILRALEVPNVPLLSFRWIDERILAPMRWGVAGTMLAAEEALESGFCWNLSGGYHHASPHSIEGFCIYNDIGLCYQDLRDRNVFSATDRMLIVDTDAHHGNGNARTFMENPQVTILDIYNAGIYPVSVSTRERVDISVPLQSGTDGPTYLKKYREALTRISGKYRLAFVVTGSDVLACDKLGGLNLAADDVVERDMATMGTLKEMGIPTVMLGGGGYSAESAPTIAKSVIACSARVARTG